MRSFVLVGVAAMLLCGSAMAETTMILEARGLGDTITAAQANAGFTLDVIIQTDLAGGMSAFEVGFNATAGNPQYAPFTVLYGAIAENYVNTAMFSNSSGWSVAPALTMVLPGGALNSLTGVPNGAASVNDTAFATSGFAVYLNILPGAGFPEDAISYINPISMIVGDSDFNGVQVTGAPLTITPEPASALLLLLGVPFLRRRR